MRLRRPCRGITFATTVVHLASVVLVKIVGTGLPTGAISLLAGLAFLKFAVWMLRGDTLTEDEMSGAATATGSAVLAVGLAFFLAELGDKTMLATITLGHRPPRPRHWVGNTPINTVRALNLVAIVKAINLRLVAELREEDDAGAEEEGLHECALVRPGQEAEVRSTGHLGVVVPVEGLVRRSRLIPVGR